jgi:hypothetical protein
VEEKMLYILEQLTVIKKYSSLKESKDFSMEILVIVGDP